MQYILAPKRNIACPADWKLRVQKIDGITATTQSANIMFITATEVAIQELKIQFGQFLRIEPPISHSP